MIDQYKRLLRPLAGAANAVFFSAYYTMSRFHYRLLPLQLPRHKRLLLLAPHVDDEVIGLGGLLASLPAAPNTVRCVYMTNGAASYHPTLTGEALIGARREEGRQVASFYGLEAPVFLDYEDGQLLPTAAVRSSLEKEIGDFNPDALFIPYFLDGHPDHVATTALALEALEEAGCRGDFPLFLYQVNSPLTAYAANRYVLMGEEAFTRKIEGLRLFRSQTLPFSVFLDLDRYRRYALTYAERQDARGAEFFRESNLQACRAVFQHFGPGVHRSFEQIRSPYALIIHYFSGWKLKKAAKALWQTHETEQ